VTPRRLLLSLVAAAALAAPASAAAADVTYDVSAFTFVKGTASGTDNDGWNSSSTYYTEIDQQIDGIKATADQDSIVGMPTNHRIYVSSLKQDYSLETVLDTYTWGCIQDGASKGAPGSVTMTRKDDLWTVELSIVEELVQPRDCTGFSAWEDEITITPGPVALTWTFTEAELAKKGYVSKTVEGAKLPCGEWTIFQVACDLQWGGSLGISRRGAAPPKDEKPIQKVTGRLNGTKSAEVEVTCTSACKGKISAVAVAKERLKAKKVGEKTFSNPSSEPRKVEIIFGKKASRTVRRRGAVVIDVRSGGQSRFVRLNAR
jgi:hypothetical protein